MQISRRSYKAETFTEVPVGTIGLILILHILYLYYGAYPCFTGLILYYGAYTCLMDLILVLRSLFLYFES